MWFLQHTTEYYYYYYYTTAMTISPSSSREDTSVSSAQPTCWPCTGRSHLGACIVSLPRLSISGLKLRIWRKVSLWKSRMTKTQRGSPASPD